MSRELTIFAREDKKKVRPRPEVARSILSRSELKVEAEEEIEGQMSFADCNLDISLKEMMDKSFEERSVVYKSEPEDVGISKFDAKPFIEETSSFGTEQSEETIDVYEPSEASSKSDNMAKVMTEAMEQGTAGEKDIPEMLNALGMVTNQAVFQGIADSNNRFRDIHEFDKMDELDVKLLQSQKSQKHLYNVAPDPNPKLTSKKMMYRTIPMHKIGENTIPVSFEYVLREETPEEKRIRILNDMKHIRMSDDQRKIFTYFAKIPGMDQKILKALYNVYEHVGEDTSCHGNIAIMGAAGTGKSRLSYGLIVAMCKDLFIDVAKIARLHGSDMNCKDPVKIVAKMSGGFLVIENASDMTAKTIDQLNRAMEVKTDCMIMIIEDEKENMRTLLKQYPKFAGKFEQVISIPVFTNDELMVFARTYATENGCKIDAMGVLALYTLISNNQLEEEPMTISRVKEIVDNAIAHAKKGRCRFGWRSESRCEKNKNQWTVLYEKDFII